MKKALLMIAILLALLATWVIAMRLGFRSALKLSDKDLDSVQATLAFNRIMDDRRMEYLLAKGCIDQAKRHVDISKNLDTEVLAEIYKRGITPDATEYINDRDPKLLPTLSAFKNKYGTTWTENACK